MPVHFEIEMSIGVGEPISLETENLSLNGLLCRPDQRLVRGNRGAIRLCLTPEVVMTIQAEVVRSDQAGVAIAFTEIGAEDFHHLKKLLEYNTQDADRINQELHYAGFSPKAN